MTRLQTCHFVRLINSASLTLILLLTSCTGQTIDADESAEAGAVPDSELVQSALASLEESCGIRFDGMQLPNVEFAMPRSDLQATISDYLLFKFLGFVVDDIEDYAGFTDTIANQRLGSYDIATATVRLHPRLKDASADIVLVALLHELVHSWHLQVNSAVAESLEMGIRDAPDSYLSALAMAEGLAVTCAEAWLQSRRGTGFGDSDSGNLALRRPNGSERSWFTDENFAELSRFHKRTWQWVYGLGSSYFEAALSQIDAKAIGDLATSPLPTSTAELMEYQTVPQCEGDCRSLGALLMREMLIWSGIDWQNSDAVSSSVLEDTLEWSDDRDGNTCIQLHLVYGELETVHPRSLGVRDAIRRWAAIHGHSIVLDVIDSHDDGQSMLTVQRCYSRKAIREALVTGDRTVARYIVAAPEPDVLELDQEACPGAVLIPEEGGSVVDALFQAVRHGTQAEDVKAILSDMARDPEAYVESLPGEEAHWLRVDATNALDALTSVEPSSLRPAPPSATEDPLSFTIRRDWL
ncbi:MAG: hypothetical protein OXH86_17900 [Acidimicrobiaceae bacterium]|nr:hypothetical protein [Acidimicrobiaceae bacterium]